MKPTGSNVVMGQDQAQSGSLSVDFDRPGVYPFHCKIHPYMTAVVGVADASGNGGGERPSRLAKENRRAQFRPESRARLRTAWALTAKVTI